MEYSMEEIVLMLRALAAKGIEPELSLFLRGKRYMIIVYEDYCSFQRCGYRDCSGEVRFATLEELFETETIDGILLRRDWDKITGYDCFEFQWLP